MRLDGKEVYGKDLEQVARWILGPEGVDVRLGFASADDSYTECVLTRALPVNRYHCAVSALQLSVATFTRRQRPDLNRVCHALAVTSSRNAWRCVRPCSMSHKHRRRTNRSPSAFPHSRKRLTEWTFLGQQVSLHCTRMALSFGRRCAQDCV